MPGIESPRALRRIEMENGKRKSTHYRIRRSESGMTNSVAGSEIPASFVTLQARALVVLRESGMVNGTRGVESRLTASSTFPISVSPLPAGGARRRRSNRGRYSTMALLLHREEAHPQGFRQASAGAGRAVPARDPDRFLPRVPAGRQSTRTAREDQGLHAALKSVFPISSYSGNAALEYVELSPRRAAVRRARVPLARHELRRAAARAPCAW